MACFVVPAAEAIVTTIAAKAVKSKEEIKVHTNGVNLEKTEKIPFSRKLKWLNNLLWGGSALLAFEHVWHGEITAWFPFLTAAGDAATAMEMLREMATAGVSMSVLATAVWLCMVAVSSAVEKKSAKGLSKTSESAN